MLVTNVTNFVKIVLAITNAINVKKITILNSTIHKFVIYVQLKQNFL